MPDFDKIKEIKAKNKSEQEKKLRSFSFAKLYFLNKDYTSALRNANEYLTIKEQSAPCHKLIGEIYDALDDFEKAYESYRKSYLIDNSQDDILLKICRTLENLDKDPDTVKKWLEKVEKLYPYHSTVVNLKEKLSLLNVSYKSQISFKDISSPKISDLTDDTINNNRSFSNIQNTNISSIHIKNLEKSVDHLNRRLGNMEEKFSNFFNKIIELTEGNKKMFGTIKDEIGAISSTLNHLQIGQQEIKTSITDFVNREDEEYNEDEENDDDEEDENYDSSSNAENLNYSSNDLKNNSEKKTNIFSRLAPMSNKPVEFQNSQVANQFQMNNQKTSSQFLQLKDLWKCKTCNLINQKDMYICVSCGTSKYIDFTQPSPLEKLSNTVEKTVTEVSKINFNEINKNIPLSELFKDQNKDTWECNTCYVKNKLSINKCISCETPKITSTIKEIDKPIENVTFSFGIQPSNTKISPGKFVFDSQPKKNNFVKNESPNSAFIFGQQNTSSINNQIINPTPNFVFGTQSQTIQNSSLLPQSIVQQNVSHEPFSLTNNSAKNFFSPPKTNISDIFNLKQSEVFSPTTQALNISKSSKEEDSNFSFNSQKNFTFTFDSNLITNNTTFPKTLAKSTTKIEKSNNEVNKSDNNDSHTNDEPQVDFVPVISLPPKIDVVTGEENEKVIFSNRSKLYRYSLNEWKERGLGEVKILHNVEKNKFRLLMRREQILKVCLNHPITTDFTFQKNTKPDSNTLVWAATDYSEGEPQPSLFTIRFKTHEILKKFEKEINNIVNILSKNDKNVKQDFINYDDVQIVYVKQPKCKEEAEKAKSLMLPINFFSYKDVAPCKGCLGCNDTIPKLNYELEKSDKKTEIISTDTQNNSNLFSDLIQKENVTSWPVSTDKPSWLSTSKPAPIFSFSSNTTTDDPEAEANLQFKPVVPMPNLIEVTTGEEEEDILFSIRSKLYKFVKNEWKERGVGDFKILKHKKTEKIRFLMRRDQVHKICLNHNVDSSLNIALRKDTENILQWFTTDFSDGEGEPSLFNLKLKNKEVALNFLETLRKNITNLKC